MYICDVTPTAGRCDVDSESYDSVREKWTREDDLINHRLSWLIYAEGLLLTAYGVLLGVTDQSKFFLKAEKLISLFPVLGIVISLVIGLAVCAAISAQTQLNRRQLTKPAEQRYDLRVHGGLTLLGYVPPIVFPIFFVIVWIVIWVA
jgi:hypothetical protein